MRSPDWPYQLNYFSTVESKLFTGPYLTAIALLRAGLEPVCIVCAAKWRAQVSSLIGFDSVLFFSALINTPWSLVKVIALIMDIIGHAEAEFQS